MSDTRFALVSRLLDGAVDRLSKQIRGLPNLTLKITSAQPLSAVSRHTAPYYPLPHPLAGGGGPAGVGRIPRCLEPTELLLQLEGSGMHQHQPMFVFFLCSFFMFVLCLFYVFMFMFMFS